MSRQDVGRAALRLLTSHEEEDDELHIQHKQQHPPSQEQEHQQSSSTASIASSYFGGNALQITDSPTTSPVLSASTFHRYDTYPRSIGQRRRIARGGSGNTSTPGTNDVPSLSLSNSSFSDGPLRSPFSEHTPSQTSVSSTRTVIQQPSVSSFEHDRQAKAVPEATLRRVASTLQMPIEEVRKVQRCMSLDTDSYQAQTEEVADNIGRERYNRIVQAFRSEEARSSRMNSFQSSYLRTETLPVESTSHQYRQQYSNGPPQLPVRSTPLSPSVSSHDDLDFLDRSGPIPSPRAALELLAAGSTHHAQPHSPISPTSGFEPYSSRIYPPHRQTQYWGSSVRSPYHRHSRQTSGGARPISLPDRSYHSMDDYTPQGVPPVPPLLRGDSSLSVRQSRHVFVSSPTQQQSSSRTASRSPLIESPAPLEDDDMEAVETDESMAVRSASRSPSHLRPGPLSSRQRCASNYENDGYQNNAKASRRASAEVLGHSIKRTTSPLVIRENLSNGTGVSASNSQPISHEEVMARLQRKVKERLAARGAGQDLSSSNVIVGGRSSSQKAARSPNMSKHTSLPYGSNPGSIGRSGRKRQDSLVLVGQTSAARRGTNAGGQSKPRKRDSLRGVSREMERKASEAENGGDAKMEDLYDNSGTAGMGIEALLSAAAIADNPRRDQ